MSLLSPLEGIAEVVWAAEAEEGGSILGVPSGRGSQLAPTFAKLLKGLAAAGSAAGLGEFHQLTMKRSGQLHVAAARNGSFLLAEVDPLRGASRVERALDGWRNGAPSAPRPIAPAQHDAAVLTPLPNQLGPGAAFSGGLGEFSVPDLLEFLRGAQRSGVLVLTAAARAGVLRFGDGWIVGASPILPLSGQPQGPSEVSPAHLDQLLKESLNPTVADLQTQTLRALREYVTWTDGTFSFTTVPTAAPSTPGLAVVDGRQALFDVFSELDDATEHTLSMN